ncbi:MAG TPA: hypothetical protein VJY39_00910 [Acidisphaera sp.]|nr:hypothetical protein [Acidisphaera sp.]
MPILNPDHFFDQAEKLASSPLTGTVRQVDLRRAISSAYYGLFHFVLTAAADEFVGVTRRSRGQYTLLYRSIDHRTLKDLCIDVAKQNPPRRYASYVPSGFDANVLAFADAAVELQERRHIADYDPQPRFRTADAKLAVEMARSAIERFKRAKREHRRDFLILLLCPPR